MDTKSRKGKAAVSFIAFVLGGLLLLVSIPLGAIGVANWRQVTDVFQSDYQNTSEFQRKISRALTDMLDAADRAAIGETVDYAAVAYDPNIRCEVWVDGKKAYASHPSSLLQGAPPGFNFYLAFDGEKVTATKDDKPLDIYGDGYYSTGQGWNVPGFLNNPARNEHDKRVEVYLAAPKVPVLYPGAARSTLYHITVDMAQNRQIVLWLCAIPVGGVVLFAIYIILRKDKKQADMALARGTGKIWAELKLILAALMLLLSLGAGILYRPNSVLLLPFLFLLYLYINDLRYNGWHNITRQSLCGTLMRLWRCDELKWPVEKRLRRRAVAIFVTMTPFALMGMIWGFNLFRQTFGRSSGVVGVFLLALLGLLCLLAQITFLRRGMADAHELALLTDQIEALKRGDFSAPCVLPEDADLRAAAESLSGLRAGMETAIAERTRSERMKVELITNVSHDLKTPLTSIVSYAELLSREEGLPDHVKDYVTILNQKAQRLKTMVQEVFEVSKAASGDLPVNLEELDLCKLLRQTLADMEGAVTESGRTIITALPDAPVTIRADGDRLYRVFQNLLQNALQYSLEDARIYLALTGQGEEAVVTLKNISKAPLPAGLDLTERFVRGDESRTDGGSGLGLAIAGSFAAACGGRLVLTTDADLFTAAVTFPQAPPPSSP